MSTFQIVATAVIGVLATARLTRLLVHDTYPPSAWVRDKWRSLTHDGAWSELVGCHYCAAPYFAVLVLLAGEWSDYNPWWYYVCGVLAGSYVAAIVVSFDGD